MKLRLAILLHTHLNRQRAMKDLLREYFFPNIPYQVQKD
jgi:hypothetical protein